MVIEYARDVLGIAALAGDDEAAVAQLLLVGHVHLVAMAVAFGHMRRA
mgnify:CR=1 FL=1